MQSVRRGVSQVAETTGGKIQGRSVAGGGHAPTIAVATPGMGGQPPLLSDLQLVLLKLCSVLGRHTCDRRSGKEDVRNKQSCVKNVGTSLRSLFFLYLVLYPVASKFETCVS